MAHPHNFGQTPPPPMAPFNQQTVAPTTSTPNSHFVPNQFFPPQHNMNNYPVAMNNRPPMPQNLPFNVFNQNPQMQGINQLLQLQMLMAGNLFAAQNVPFNANAQNVGFHMNAGPPRLNLQQNAPFVGNAQMGFSDPGGVLQSMANLIASNGAPMGAQQLQGSLSSAQGTGTVPPLQNQTNFHARPPQFQGNQRNSNGTNSNVMKNEKPAHFKNHKQNPRHEASGNRNMKPRFQKMQNTKGNFSPPNAQMRRGKANVGGRQNSLGSAVQDQVEQKRSFTLNYSDEEIRQWREERKKHYPSKANLEKKLMEKTTKPEIIDEAHLRRQRLKEVLAKQAELGCEVAEIPSHYLLDSEQQSHGTKKGEKHSRKRENFLNRFKKRGRFDKNDSYSNNKFFAKVSVHHEDAENDFASDEKRLENNAPVSHHAMKEREPTLLQKLLKADIQRDKHHLMQALRFMVSNSFFENWPKSQLNFPPVVVKEAKGEGVLNVQESTGKKNGPSVMAYEQSNRKIENNNYCNNTQQNKETGSSFGQGIGTGESEQEEGEIIE